jgi:protein phosphatase
MSLAASGVTHQGRRSTNEDTWLVDLDLGLLVVADGMGGHNAGEVASTLAVQVIREFLKSSGVPPTKALLEEAVESANERILNDAARYPDYAGMGTTVVAVVVSGDRVFYTSVGDSRLYLWHGGQLTQLTRDDSWLAEALGEDEGLRSQNVGTHPMRHVLTRVVGLRPELQAKAAEYTFDADDCLLLCSDGVHGVVPPETLADILGGEHNVADIAQGVVRSAIARGATDNATVVVARLAGSR